VTLVAVPCDARSLDAAALAAAPVRASIRDDADGAALRRWIVDHQVCWELSPHTELHLGVRVLTGADLELFARMPGELDPGSSACLEARDRLHEISLRAVPQGMRCFLSPFDAAFYLRPQMRFEPMIRLGVEIRHREGTFEPLDSSEQRLLRIVRDRLADLGAAENAWSARHAPQPR
jgi:hypothetical protein